MTQPDSSSSSITAAESPDRDVEEQKNRQEKASHWSLVFDQTHVTKEVLEWNYKGCGTEKDPYIVEYIENDLRNPMTWTDSKKWTITILVAFVSPQSPKSASNCPTILTESTGNPHSLLRLFSILRLHQRNPLGVPYRRRSRHPRSLPLRPGLRNRSPAMGTNVRTLWPPNTILRHLHDAHSLQCRRSGLAKHPNFDHPAILRWSIRLVTVDEFRGCDCGYVPRQPAGTGDECFRQCAVPRTNPWTNRWRISERDGGLAMG
jgi:hypothetical protein